MDPSEFNTENNTRGQLVSPMVRIPEALKYLRCGRTKLYERIKNDPRFPKLRKFGRGSYFIRKELEAYVTGE